MPNKNFLYCKIVFVVVIAFTVIFFSRAAYTLAACNPPCSNGQYCWAGIMCANSPTTTRPPIATTKPPIATTKPPATTAPAPPGGGGDCRSTGCPSGQSCSYLVGQYICTSTTTTTTIGTGCTPNCSGKNCGSNGCGGSCGTCSSGQSCWGGYMCAGTTTTTSPVASCTPYATVACTINYCAGIHTCNYAGTGYGECSYSYPVNCSVPPPTTCTPYVTAPCIMANGCAGHSPCNDAGNGYGSCYQNDLTCTGTINAGHCGLDSANYVVCKSDGTGTGASCNTAADCPCSPPLCVPNCDGKSCGASDGCTGICFDGRCSSGSTCLGGTCVCIPEDCTGKACGYNAGCGITCLDGSCSSGQICENGACIIPPCSITSFSINSVGRIIILGGSFGASWSSDNCFNGCTLSCGPNGCGKGLPDSNAGTDASNYKITPTSSGSYSYTLTCSNARNTDSRTIGAGTQADKFFRVIQPFWRETPAFLKLLVNKLFSK